jgi:hypothetical protein
MLQVTAGQLHLVDLNAVNGTYVNNHRLEGGSRRWVQAVARWPSRAAWLEQDGNGVVYQVARAARLNTAASSKPPNAFLSPDVQGSARKRCCLFWGVSLLHLLCCSMRVLLCGHLAAWCMPSYHTLC